MKFGLYHIILLAVIARLLVIVVGHSDKFLTRFDYETLAQIYSNSQYVLGPAAKTSIGDDGLFSVAGYYLVFQGGNPAQIDFENPPLGKYLIGVSIWLFQNERVFSIFYGALLLLVTYKLSLILFKQKLVALVSVLILSLDPLFESHVISNLLDLPQALYVTIAIYLFIYGLNKPKYLFLSSFFWGLAFANKFFPGIIFYLLILGVWCYRQKKPHFKLWLISLSLIPLIYLFSYIRFFTLSNTFFDFINFQKWLMVWRLGNPRVLGNIFLTVLLGKYRDWWGANSWQVYSEWSIITPIIFFGGVFSVFVKSIRKNIHFIYLYIISIIFIGYVAIGTTGVVKYLYPVYPLLSIFFTQLLASVLTSHKFVKD